MYTSAMRIMQDCMSFGFRSLPGIPGFLQQQVQLSLIAWLLWSDLGDLSLSRAQFLVPKSP